MDWSARETLIQMYQMLGLRGEAIPPDRRNVQPLPNTYYQHPQHGRVPMRADLAVLSSGVSRVYADTDVRDAFEALGIGVDTMATAFVSHLLKEYHDKGLVWGFSGYATPGYRYIEEANGIRALLGCLLTLGKTPSLVTDGGVSAGVLGLASVLAARSKVPIPTLGFIPRQGLDSIGPHTYLAVRGNTYPERESMVALAPDVLVCVGGDQGTQRECERALLAGGVVLLLALKQYPASTALTSAYRYSPTLRQALEEGRLVVCNDLASLPTHAKRIVRAAGEVSVPTRANRMRLLEGQMSF